MMAKLACGEVSTLAWEIMGTSFRRMSGQRGGSQHAHADRALHRAGDVYRQIVREGARGFTF
ncbi:hypothetical protein [uncultured Desulfovibrio sp.]|uniref:hypothetical protein n=1 Tax=uncultured Desulfovibrio sp. TaxID=167968 RepID=UPI00262D28CA|nr:hypothetical protein [uncultured Desulfovibrio sp.]